MKSVKTNEFEKGKKKYLKVKNSKLKDKNVLNNKISYTSIRYWEYSLH